MQASKYFCMIFLVSWIARRSKTTFVKFDNFWNILEPSKYISLVFKSLLDCQKVKNIFPEVWQFLECLETFKIFFYGFFSLLDCQKVKDNFSEVWQVLECLASFKIFFYNFEKSTGLPEGQKSIYWSLTSPGMSWNLQNNYLWFLKVSWLARRSKVTFLECLGTLKIFFYDS